MNTSRNVGSEREFVNGCILRGLLNFVGSEREFVNGCILRGLLNFVKSDVLGVGDGHAPYLQE